MRDFRFGKREALCLFLEPTVCTGQPMFMLPQVLRPGADEIGLDEPGGVTAIAKELPAQGAPCAAGIVQHPAWHS